MIEYGRKLLCWGRGGLESVWGRTGEGGRNLEQKVRAEGMEAVGFCWTSPDGGSGELPVEDGGTYPQGGEATLPGYSVSEGETPDGLSALCPRCTCEMGGERSGSRVPIGRGL